LLCLKVPKNCWRLHRSINNTYFPFFLQTSYCRYAHSCRNIPVNKAHIISGWYSLTSLKAMPCPRNAVWYSPVKR
jgi:hypothetical protein